MHAAAGDPPPIHLSLAGQALITILKLRYRTRNTALAALCAVSASTVSTALDHAWPLLVNVGYPTEPAGSPLKTVPELTAYAAATASPSRPATRLHSHRTKSAC